MHELDNFKIINLGICIQGLPMCLSDKTRRYDFCRSSTFLWTVIVQLLQFFVMWRIIHLLCHFQSVWCAFLELIGSLRIGNSHQ